MTTILYDFQKLRYLTTPSELWGPALPKHRQLVDYVPDFILDPHAARLQIKGQVYTVKPRASPYDNPGFVPDSVMSTPEGTLRHDAVQVCELFVSSSFILRLFSFIRSSRL